MKCTTLKLCLLAALLTPSLLVHAGPGAHGPNGEHLDTAVGVNASGLVRLPDGSVNVPKLAQRRMAIRTVLAPETEAAATLELPARVVQDPNASGRVQASHGGRIEPGPKGLPVAGQSVQKGEILAWLRHHAEPYAEASQKALRAELRASRQVADQRVQRLESLEGTVPRKVIEAARVEAQSLATRERSIADSLDAREALRAPVSGVVARADLSVGQVIDARDVLIEVIDPTRLMIEAVTPDVTLASRIASAQLGALPGVKLQLVGAARALRDGVLPLSFRAQSDKPGQAAPLAIGQPVTLIVALKEQAKGMVLPAEALVRNAANEQLVWIKSGAERFIPQPVRAKPLDAKTVLVTQGLAADNRVVVQGAALIAQIR
jgi:cobalt-zinc-cadmium efflux system membrane fusion protein